MKLRRRTRHEDRWMDAWEGGREGERGRGTDGEERWAKSVAAAGSTSQRSSHELQQLVASWRKDRR